MSKNKPQKGFTLIELLVVVAIISLLSSVVLGALNDARAKARDRALVQQVKQIQNALELYKVKYGEYPDNTPALIGDVYTGWSTVSSAGTWSGTNPAVWTLQSKLSEFLPVITLPKTGSIGYYHIKGTAVNGQNRQWCSDDLSPTIASPYVSAEGRAGAPDYTIIATFETDFKNNFPTFVYNNVQYTSSCFSVK